MIEENWRAITFEVRNSKNKTIKFFHKEGCFSEKILQI